MTEPTASPSPGPDDPPCASARDLFAQLEGVSRTLTIPLLARYLAGTRPDPIITDPAAARLLGALGLTDLSGDWSFRAVEVGTAVRTKLLDAAVRDLASAHPGLSLITLGAGLCTRCLRLDGIDATWIDLDLPAVAALRRALLPPGPDRAIIAGSVLSRGWRDTITQTPVPRLFILEGLAMYLHEPDLHSMLTDLADRSPAAICSSKHTAPAPTRQSFFSG
jgi:O-methyltransferase involved in polyketide biosynthesis